MTAINYPDLAVESPSGRIRLTVRSPDNDPVSPRDPEDPSVSGSRRFWGGFQSDFVLTATEAASGDVLWTHSQGPDEPGPVAAGVDDDGRAVIITRATFSSHVIVFNSAGERALELDVETLLPENEFHWTSAGPHWNRSGLTYVTPIVGRSHWCIRTFFNRRLLIDLETPRLITDMARFKTQLEQEERDRALRGLGAEIEPSDEPDWNQVEQLLVALRLTGLMGLGEATPNLQRLEASVLESGYTYRNVHPSPQAPDGSFQVVFLPLRQMAQLSLRRLGIEPAGYSPFLLRAGDEDDRPIDVPQRIPARAARAPDVQIGMDFWEVAQLLGVPDFFHAREECDYDIGLRDGYTLKLTWDEEQRVAAIEEIRPPAWTDVIARDLRIM